MIVQKGKGQWLNPQNTVIPQDILILPEDITLLRKIENRDGAGLQAVVPADERRKFCGNRDLDIVVGTVEPGNHSFQYGVRAAVDAVMKFVIDFAMMLFTVAMMLSAVAAVAQQFASDYGNIHIAAVVATVHVNPD